MAEQRMMDGKVVIVTGSGGGIGRDIALLMAREGAKVLINDVGASLTGEGQSVGPAQQVVEEIESFGGEATASTDSVADPAGAARIVQQAIDTFGRIDCVVNNAGILRDRFFKMSDEERDAVLKVHLYGSYYVSRAAADYFKEQGGGAFVHIDKIDLGPDRQPRRRRTTAPRSSASRPVEIHRARSAEVRRAIELHRCLSRGVA